MSKCRRCNKTATTIGDLFHQAYCPITNLDSYFNSSDFKELTKDLKVKKEVLMNTCGFCKTNCGNSWCPTNRK